MSYLSIDVELLESDETRPFWEHCAQQMLAFQTCQDCGHTTHPPIAICPHCQSPKRGWREAPAEARVFSFTWAHVVPEGSLTPYNVALIEFPALPGVRLVSNVVSTSCGELRIGDTVELVWESYQDRWIPRFRKLETT